MDDLLTIDEMLALLGRRLADLRIARGMTQGDLSRQTGVSVGTIQRIESGIDSKLSTFILLLQAFDLDMRLETIIPDQTQSPIQIHRNQNKMPKRCSARRKRLVEQENKKPWVWGEDR